MKLRTFIHVDPRVREINIVANVKLSPVKEVNSGPC